MGIETLIERCRKGEEDALGELYKSYAPRLRSVCRRYISNEDMVNDALHDAFVIIFTSLDSLREDSKAEAWMISIVRNVALKCNDYAEVLPTISLEEINELEIPPIEEGATDVRGIPLPEVIKLIDKLPEGYKQVFNLSVFEGLTHKEIAAMLGIEPHSSSSQLTRAKQMLRKMMQQYWVLLLLLLIQLPILLLKKGDNDIKETIIAGNEEKHDNDTTNTWILHTTEYQEKAIAQEYIPINEDTLSALIVHNSDSLHNIDTLSPITANQKSIDTIPSVHIDRRVPKDNYTTNDAINIIKTQRKHNWHLALAYSVTALPDINRTDNYMTIPSSSVAGAPSARLYNWGEYMEYVNNNVDMMDSVNAQNMRRVAIFNSYHPMDSLTEKKHHSMPITVQISLSRQLNSRWSLSTGLSYSLLRSNYESGNENTLIKRSQKLHYLGIPLRFSYKLTGGTHWNLYASGGLQLDMPIGGSMTTNYIYGGPYADIEQSSITEPVINAPWMLSVGIGAGVQYEVIPHMTLYLEPNINYYAPLTKGIETYRTERPFDFTIPLGVRFTW